MAQRDNGSAQAVFARFLGLPVGAVGFIAGRVEIKGVFLNLEPPIRGDFLLQPFNLRVVKFFDVTAIGAHQMVVMLAFVDLEHGFARVEKMPFKNAGLLKLGQNPVHGRKANIQTLGDQEAVNVFRAQVTNLGVLEQLKNLQAGMSGLEAHFSEITLRHGIPLLKGASQFYATG
jgi:hypothetical protein